jgi:hypothetical protein
MVGEEVLTGHHRRESRRAKFAGKATFLPGFEVLNQKRKKNILV